MSKQNPTTIEQWKDVPHYDGYYSVSNHGRVRRNITRGGTRISKILNASIFKAGYPMVKLCKNAVQKHRSVHSLVMEAFVGPRPDGYDVNHRDHNRDNNVLNNLEYLTRSQNIRHGRGTKLTQELVNEIRAKHPSIRGSLTRLAAEYKIDKSHCCAILKGKWWK